MNFKEASTQVTSWLQAHPSYQLIYADETESRFQFSSTDNALSSFQVFGPKSSSHKWSVGTDIDSVIPNLKAAKTWIQSQEEVTIESILDFIVQTNTSSSMQNSGCDEPMDDGAGGGGDDSDDDNYDPDDFPEEDDDVLQYPIKKISKEDHEDNTLELSLAYKGSPLAVTRLVKDMKNLQKTNGQFGISGGPRGENLFVWDMKLTDFPKETKLGEDLAKYAKQFKREAAVQIEMLFPDSFPMEPPFVRIVRPRFKFLTGHVTIGGSICMEMLTRSGWSPGNDIESILVQIRTTIMSDKDARLEGGDKEYSVAEAKDSFRRMVEKYKW